jgi:N-acetylglucosamine-6-phosphate deacetylase
MTDATRRALVAVGVAGAATAWLRTVRRAESAPVRPDPTAPSEGTIELPGLVDLQVNGFAGVDFSDPSLANERVHEVVEALARTGVTRFLPTLISSPPEMFAACARTIGRASDPAIAGIHMEGPYLSPEDGYRGAHARAFVRDPDVDDFERRQDAARGRIRLLTLAPERPGALRLIEHAVARGVRVAVGHTAASGAQLRDAVKAGATLSTHLGNGCPAVLPRHPNVIWEQLAEDGLLASFIVDGHHLPPATLKAMLRAKTAERSLLVTDAMAAAGMPPGRYTLGGQPVELDASGRVAAPGATNLAGSALSLDVAIGNVVRFTGLRLDEVVPMASTRPARYLGIETAGRLAAEWDAAASRLRVLRVKP